MSSAKERPICTGQGQRQRFGVLQANSSLIDGVEHKRSKLLVEQDADALVPIRCLHPRHLQVLLPAWWLSIVMSERSHPHPVLGNQPQLNGQLCIWMKKSLSHWVHWLLCCPMLSCWKLHSVKELSARKGNVGGCLPGSGVLKLEPLEELQSGLQGRHDRASDQVEVSETLPARKHTHNNHGVVQSTSGGDGFCSSANRAGQPLQAGRQIMWLHPIRAVWGDLQLIVRIETLTCPGPCGIPPATSSPSSQTPACLPWPACTSLRTLQSNQPAQPLTVMLASNA